MRPNLYRFSTLILCVLFVPLLAQNKKKLVQEVTVTTYNVCTDRRTNFPENSDLSFTKRLLRLLKQIKAESSDIIVIQELRDFPGVESNRLLLESGLNKLGYRCESKPYNNSKMAFNSLICYKADKFKWNRGDHWNSLGGLKKEDFSKGWPRVQMVGLLYPCKKINHGGKEFFGEDYKSLPLLVANVHNSMTLENRLDENHRLAGQLLNKIKAWSKDLGTKIPAIICGDFNAFSDKAEKELDVLNKAGFEVISKNVKTSDGVSIKKPFFPGYAYDKFRPSLKQIEEGDVKALDFILFKKPVGYSYESSCTVNLKKYNGKDVKKPKKVTDYLVGPDGKDCRNELCSDHAPYTARIKIYKEIKG